MKITRRNALLTTLFGAGGIGLRALATGLPVSFFLDPRKALADAPTCPDASKAQFIIMSATASGDPINTNVPGTYEIPALVHPADPLMAMTPLSLMGKTHNAAKPWSTLPQNVLDRTCFFHLMTGTPVHPKHPEVLALMGQTAGHEMLPSLLSKALAPCLKTIQAQPISIGANGPSEALAFGGQTMPIIPPIALKDTLTNPAGPLTNLQALRDKTMKQVYDIYKNTATPAGQQYMDQMIASQDQVRALRQDLLSTLASIKDNSLASQITAAITLIQLNVSPVVAIRIPFGGDNHSDAGLAAETAQTVSGVAAIGSLMAQLASAGLSDKVTFMTLDVFGRTYATNGGTGTSADAGRNHNGNGQTSVIIGKPFKGCVVGGVGPVQNDYGATGIDSTTGASTTTGDIAAADTLASFGKTMLASVGADTSPVMSGKVVTAALA
jgi:hypothetical protein